MFHKKPLQACFSAVVLSTLMILFPAGLQAQFTNIDRLIAAGKQDAQILTEEYVKPLPSGFGAGLNAGWNSSASARHPLGFSIQVRGSFAAVPTTDQTFDVDELSLNRLEKQDPSNEGISPTISGNEMSGERPTMVIRETVRGQTYEVGELELPPGTGFQYVPSPLLQASIGLPYSSEITGRIVPEIDFGDYGSFKMFGLGAKHEVSQYIPGGNMLPVSLSLMAGFNKIDITGNLDLDPEEGVPQENPETDYENQSVETSFNSFTVNALVGKDLPIVSVYAGVGLETSSMDLDVRGDYPVTVYKGNPPEKVVEDVTHPVSYTQDGANNVHALVGGSVSLLFFDFMVEATLGKYSVVNAGVGFGL